MGIRLSQNQFGFNWHFIFTFRIKYEKMNIFNICLRILHLDQYCWESVESLTAYNSPSSIPAIIIIRVKRSLGVAIIIGCHGHRFKGLKKLDGHLDEWEGTVASLIVSEELP